MAKAKWGTLGDIGGGAGVGARHGLRKNKRDPFFDLTTLGVPFGAPVFAPTVGLPVETIPPLEGYVRFKTFRPPWRTLDVLTTGEPYLMEDSFGGIDIVDRPLRPAVTVWRGSQPLRQAIPMTMDVLRFGGDIDVDDEWRALEEFARPGGGQEPRVLKLAGPVCHPEHRWWVDDIQVDETTTKRVGTRLVRQEALVTLTQYVPADLADYADPDQAKGTAIQDRPRSVKAHKGDTLKAIAKRELHDRRKWHELARLNHGTAWAKGPDRPIRAGTTVRLPNG